MDIAKLAIEVDASQATAAAKQLQTFGAEAAKADKATAGVGKASAAAGKEAGNSAYKYRMAAMQLSQVASQGSVTGNYIQALAIQLPDLALGFGTVGIVAGALAGALAMPLINALRGTSKSVDDLIDDVARLAGQFDEAADGSYKLSEELVRIARVSQEAARLRLRIDTEQAKESLEGVRSAMADTLAEGLSVGRQSFGLAGIIERGGLSAALGPDLRSLRATTKLTYEELNKLGTAADAARGSLDPKAYSQLALVVDNLKEKYGESNKTVNILSSGLAEQIPLAIEATQTLNRLTGATDNFDDMLRRSTETSAAFAEQMTMFDKGAYSLDDWLREQEAAMKGYQALMATAVTEGFTPEQAAAQTLGERARMLQEWRDNDLISDAQYKSGLENAEQAHSARIISIKEAQLAKERRNNAAALGAAADLFGNLAAIAEKGGEEQFDNWKNFASAQAAVSAALAITNALTVTPAPLGIALAGTIGALAAVQIAEIQQQEYTPARALGGQVTAGTTYLVGERGPEMVTMGANGYVTPNDKLGGNNQTVVLQISTGVSQTVRAEMAAMMPGIVKMIGQATQGARR